MRCVLITLVALISASPSFATSFFAYDFVADREGKSFSSPEPTIADTAEGFAQLTGKLVFTDTIVDTTATSTTYGGLSLTIDQFSIAGAFTPVGLVVDDIAPPGPAPDRISALVQDLPPDSVFYDRVSFFLFDFTQTALTSTDPPAAIDLGDFGTARLLFTASQNTGTSSSARERTDFTFTSLTRDTSFVPPPAIIPLPATWALLTAALGSLGLLHRRG